MRLESYTTSTDGTRSLENLWELLDTRPAWQGLAACRDAPAEVTWFPENGKGAEAAKRVCARCPVVRECRAWALTQTHLVGVWGGLSDQDRRRYRRADKVIGH